MEGYLQHGNGSGGFGMKTATMAQHHQHQQPIITNAAPTTTQYPPGVRAKIAGANRPRPWTGQMTRTIAHYQRLEQIGEGAYGQVYKARCKATGRLVAMKKLIIQHAGYNGMTPSVIREIKILQRLRHPRLVEMIEVVSSKGVEHLDDHDEHRGEQKAKEAKEGNTSKSESRIIDAREGLKGNLFLVLEYVSYDLMALLDVRYQFSEVQVKCIFKQLLEALEYMHDQKYVHRDLKPANILIDSQHRVKLADFGLARCIEPPILDKIHDRRSTLELTNKVVTVMYRAPEILLGSTRYGYAIDIWSAGCILGELVIGKTLLPGKMEMEQIQLIFDLMGTPKPKDGLNDLTLLKSGQVKIDKPKPGRLREKYINRMPAPCLNLLEKLLELDPAKRLTAGRALDSRYFRCDPRPPDNELDLGPLQIGNGEGDFHEFQTKKKRKEAKAIANARKEEARESGMSNEQAEAIFKEVYDGQMERVRTEGASALKTKAEIQKEEEKRLKEAERERQEEKDRLKAIADARDRDRKRHHADDDDYDRHKRRRDNGGHADDERRSEKRDESRRERKKSKERRRDERRSSKDDKREKRSGDGKREHRRSAGEIADHGDLYDYNESQHESRSNDHHGMADDSTTNGGSQERRRKHSKDRKKSSRRDKKREKDRDSDRDRDERDRDYRPSRDEGFRDYSDRDRERGGQGHGIPEEARRDYRGGPSDDGHRGPDRRDLHGDRREGGPAADHSHHGPDRRGQHGDRREGGPPDDSHHGPGRRGQYGDRREGGPPVDGHHDRRGQHGDRREGEHPDGFHRGPERRGQHGDRREGEHPDGFHRADRRGSPPRDHREGRRQPPHFRDGDFPDRDRRRPRPGFHDDHPKDHRGPDNRGPDRGGPPDDGFRGQNRRGPDRRGGGPLARGDEHAGGPDRRGGGPHPHGEHLDGPDRRGEGPPRGVQRGPPPKNNGAVGHYGPDRRGGGPDNINNFRRGGDQRGPDNRDGPRGNSFRGGPTNNDHRQHDRSRGPPQQHARQQERRRDRRR